MRPISKNEGGQLIIEAVLIIIVLLGLVMFISSEMRSKEMLAKLVSGPWTHLSGMIQNGVWQSREDALKNHPSQYKRARSFEGAEAK